MEKKEKYNGLYSRPGIINETYSGLEWMDINYDSKSLKDIIKDSTSTDLIGHLLDVLLKDTPNIEAFCSAFGSFVEQNSIYISQKLDNDFLDKVLIYRMENSKFKTETKELLLFFKEESFKSKDLEKVLMHYGFNWKNNESSKKLVKSNIANFNMNLWVRARINNDYVEKLSFEYIK